VVTPENYEELAKALVKLLIDDELRRQMGKNGRQAVCKKYTWENAASGVADICKTATEKWTG